MEVMLTKPYPGARWGVMPGKLDGHVVVQLLNPEGVAKDVLQVGDRIVAINGYAVATEVEVVEKLNAAYDKATSTKGAKISILRASGGGGKKSPRFSKARACVIM